MEERLKKIENRLGALESIVLDKKLNPQAGQKKVSLAEIAKGPEMRKANGQHKVAAIIGYYEKIANEGPSDRAKIKTAWLKGKFVGKYHTTLIDRAIGSLVRDLDNGTYDLSQAGEVFFDSLLN